MKIFSLIILTFIFVGCTVKQEPEIKYVVKKEIVEKVVPVYCTIPKIECNFSGTGFEPTVKLIECIKIQKKALELCSNPEAK